MNELYAVSIVAYRSVPLGHKPPPNPEVRDEYLKTLVAIRDREAVVNEMVYFAAALSASSSEEAREKAELETRERKLPISAGWDRLHFTVLELSEELLQETGFQISL